MKPLFLTTLFLIFATSLTAQLRPVVSITAGGNMSTVHWYRPFELNGRMVPGNEGHEAFWGFQAGVSVELPFSEKLGILAMPSFSRRGFGSNEELLGVDSRVRLDFLDLPVLVRFYPLSRLCIEAGPAISYMVRAETIFEGEPLGNEDVMGRLYNDVDFSAVLGVGFEVNDRLMVNLRAFHGFLTMIDASFTDGNGEPLVDEDSQPKLLNQSLQLSVQYAILNP